jgi:O-antigen/teichoic acid export membrane protein
LRLRILKNAVANLGRGGVSAVVALMLPPVLLRHMSPVDYAVWVLVLQIAAYMGYLDFGLQTAVGRYIALANEKKDEKLRDGIFSTAVAGLGLAAVLGIFLIMAAVIASHRIFPKVPISLLGSMRIAMMIVGISVALGLPASAWNGVFVGLQRYEIPAISAGTGKLLSALGLIVAAITGRSLVLMACVVAATNLLSYIAQFAMLRRVAPDIRFRGKLITTPMVRELFGYCLSLTVWSISMLFISGIDLVLVGRFDFSAVTPYAVSATLVSFLGGIQVAVFGVIMPHAAGLYVQQNSRALGNLLVKTTRLGVLLLLLTGLPLIAFAAPIIKIWIGAQFAQAGGPILTILVIANMVRLTGVPYANILVGTGQQRLVIVSPLMEGVTNLVASILLGLKFGAIGVAWGTLVGAVAAVLANIFYNLPRTRADIDCSRSRYSLESLAIPALCGIPVCLVLLVTALFKSIGAAIVVPAWLVFLVACAIVVSREGTRSNQTNLYPTGSGRP